MRKNITNQMLLLVVGILFYLLFIFYLESAIATPKTYFAIILLSVLLIFVVIRHFLSKLKREKN